jgi:hypothetical protein
MEQTTLIVRAIARCEGVRREFTRGSVLVAKNFRRAVARQSRSSIIATLRHHALVFLRGGDQYGENLP